MSGGPFADWGDTEPPCGDLLTTRGCTVRVRRYRLQPDFDPYQTSLMFDMGAEDGRFAEVLLTHDELFRLADMLMLTAQDISKERGR
jgi:hypothetical protein